MEKKFMKNLLMVLVEIIGEQTVVMNGEQFIYNIVGYEPKTIYKFKR